KIMGERGPAGKRSENRIRRNAGYKPSKAGIDDGAEAPYVADENWHPVAVEMWESLPRSGQSRFYAASDWATAYLLCEQISREMKPQFIGMQADAAGGTKPLIKSIPMKGASLGAIRGMMQDLLVTEVARRRAEIELQTRDQTALADAGEAAASDMEKELGLHVIEGGKTG